MFSKDGIFSKPFEDKCWDSNDVSSRRMKICVCCAETNSIKSRLDEILKDLEKYPYKLGLLVVIVKDDNQYLSIQEDLRNRVSDLDEPRLTIALVKKPLTEEIRKKWLNAITKQDMATESGQTGAASQQSNEANIVISTWVQQVSASSQIIAWNGTQVFITFTVWRTCQRQFEQVLLINFSHMLPKKSLSPIQRIRAVPIPLR